MSLMLRVASIDVTAVLHHDGVLFARLFPHVCDFVSRKSHFLLRYKVDYYCLCVFAWGMSGCAWSHITV